MKKVFSTFVTIFLFSCSINVANAQDLLAYHFFDAETTTTLTVSNNKITFGSKNAAIHRHSRNSHQIVLEKRAISITNIRYRDGKPLKGMLSPDGKYIYLKNYQGQKHIIVTVNYEDGEVEELKKSFCFIDPIPPM